MEELRKTYKEVWAFSPGENPSTLWRGVTPENALSQIKAFIETRATTNRNIVNIVLIGYSWGGGTIHEIADWVANGDGPKLKIASSVYVDAVTNPESDMAATWDETSYKPESRLPPGTTSMLNLYQSRAPITYSDFFLKLHGTWIDNPGIRDIVQKDYDVLQDSETHSSIDEAALNDILEFIRRRIATSPQASNE